MLPATGYNQFFVSPVKNGAQSLLAPYVTLPHLTVWTSHSLLFDLMIKPINYMQILQKARYFSNIVPISSFIIKLTTQQVSLMISVYAHNKQCSAVAAPLFVTLSHLSVSINGHLYGRPISHVLSFSKSVSHSSFRKYRSLTLL